tara:strand:+ start:237 stop:614 length:378 start_codon:yes stop_codon:yes gene_type:complete
LAIAALISIASTTGAHLIALQGIAYMRMFSAYQESMSATEAFELTFSGQEICGICAAVDDIQSNMDQTLSDYAQHYSQLILIANSTDTLSLHPVERRASIPITLITHLDETIHPLATPPPRSAVA